MEKYTEQENNLNYGDELTELAQWEGLQSLPQECETVKLTEKYVRSICTKLYQKKGGKYSQPDFFDKNFQIVVSDTPEINAAHIYNQNTKDGRNILLVSKGLMLNVQNEAQLAFVLAHELGHYQVNETRGKDKNNLGVSGHEHEVQADYLGFQSVLQAGYNPDEAIKFFEMIQQSPADVKQAFEEANDVHGNTATRIANIKDYKSVAEVMGVEFSDYTGETEFKSFQEKFRTVAQNDHYISYLEERIRQENNVSSSRALPLIERLNFCEKVVSEPEIVINTGQRLNEFVRIFSENISTLAKEEATKVNAVLQKVNSYDEREVLNKKIAPICLERLPTKDENGNYYIEPFGKFAADIRFYHRVMNEPELFDYEASAHNVVNGLNSKDDHFVYPSFSLEGLQVGDTAPWVEIAAKANVRNNDYIRIALSDLGVGYDYFEHKYGDSLGYPEGMENDVYINSQGVIISTDTAEVTKLRAESKEKVANLSISERKRQMILDFHDQLVIMNQSEHGGEEYNLAKSRAKEIYKASVTAFADLDDTHDLLLNQNGFKVNASDKEHLAINVFSQEIQDRFGSYYIGTNTDAKYAQNFYPVYTEVVLETELENIMDVYHSTRYPKVEKAIGFVNNMYDNLLDMDTVSHDVISKMAPSVFKAYTDEFNDGVGDKSANCFHRIVTQTLLNDHVGANGNLPYVEEFRQRRQINDAHNTDELVANLEKMKPTEQQLVYAREYVGYTKLLYDYEVMRTINAGVKIDLNRTLNAIPGAVSPDLADKITDYALANNVFAPREGENNEQTYDRCKKMYVIMSEKQAFTQKENKQRQIEATLLNMMQQLPPERQTAEAYDLLSTHSDKELAGSILQYNGNQQIAEKFIVNDIVQRYGPDDKSSAYREKMNAELEQMANNLDSSSRKRICEQVAKGVMAQKELAFDIKKVYDFDKYTNSTKGNAVRGYNLIESYMRHQPEFAEKTMNFLLSDGSNATCEKFSADLAHEYNCNRDLLPPEWEKKLNAKLNDVNAPVHSQELKKITIPEDSFVSLASQMHEKYRNADFEERAMIMHRILDYYGKNPDSEQAMLKQISYVSDKVFGNREQDKDLLVEVKAVSTAVCHQEEQPSVLLGAVLAGREPGQADENMNVGDGLAMFCEKKGTAWVKLAQTLSYVDSLPQDIRDSLGRLKDKANEPKQWEIYKDLEEAMPESELARIKKVRKFIGGGTFNKTILVDVENTQTGKPETKVVQVLHDRAATKSKREFGKINSAIDALCNDDPKYEILKSVAERSAKNAKIEVDIKEGAKQYHNACENYGKIASVELNGVSYVPKVATWERYGESAFSNYKIMEMAPGKSIDSPEFSPEQRRDMALAYTMVELTNLMGGKAWDIDRHSKQQNFNVTKDENGKTVVEIGIFDTGAQRKAPTKQEKKLLGKFLVAVLKEQSSGKDINLSEFMLAKIKKFEKAGKDINYVSDVQRGLLAISDVMQYMNTPQNPNGIAEGLKTCFVALQKNQLIDKKLYNTLVKNIAVTAITNPKFGVSMAKTLLESTESKDNLSINLAKDNERINQQIKASVNIDKPTAETEKIELNKTSIKPKVQTLTSEKSGAVNIDVAAFQQPQIQQAAQQPVQPQVPPKTQQPQVAVKQASETVRDMSKKEKGKFFHKLRMGINTLLTKAEPQFSRTKETPQIQNTSINIQSAIKNKGRE